MVIKAIQPGHCPSFTYKGEPLQVVQSFKYLGIAVMSTNMWNVCYESTLQAGWNGYYMFENQCNTSDTGGWEVKLMLFNAMVILVLLYGVEMWGGTISQTALNEIEKIHKLFLHRQLRLKSSTSYSCHTIRHRCWVHPCKKYTSISQKSRIFLIRYCQNRREI